MAWSDNGPGQKTILGRRVVFEAITVSRRHSKEISWTQVKSLRRLGIKGSLREVGIAICDFQCTRLTVAYREGLRARTDRFCIFDAFWGELQVSHNVTNKGVIIIIENVERLRRSSNHFPLLFGSCTRDRQVACLH